MLRIQKQYHTQAKALSNTHRCWLGFRRRCVEASRWVRDRHRLASELVHVRDEKLETRLVLPGKDARELCVYRCRIGRQGAVGQEDIVLALSGRGVAEKYWNDLVRVELPQSELPHCTTEKIYNSLRHIHGRESFEIVSLVIGRIEDTDLASSQRLSRSQYAGRRPGLSLRNFVFQCQSEGESGMKYNYSPKDGIWACTSLYNISSSRADSI